MIIGYQWPTVADLMDITFAENISLDANDFVYGGTAEELIVNYVHPLFLKAKSSASRSKVQIGVRPQLDPGRR